VRYARNPEILWRLVGDRIIARHAHDRSSAGAVEASGAAALVWLCLEEPASLEQLQGDFDAVQVGPAADVAAALTLLADRQLILPDDS